jgi:hypothetical protein
MTLATGSVGAGAATDIVIAERTTIRVEKETMMAVVIVNS